MHELMQMIFLYLSVPLMLPEGYKMVFNLYAIEGFSHKEIADQLNISENTSYSQYSRAKELLRKWLTNEKKSFMQKVS
ncbi:MAG: sigma-70 region 4 domain-containing protein [Bacteroidetes bacterium]|nr:sigma-70 region 4 domain-containing protein [Bacteroidota bacterium]